eukprot:6458460-Amphidinium_carterae.2
MQGTMILFMSPPCAHTHSSNNVYSSTLQGGEVQWTGNNQCPQTLCSLASPNRGFLQSNLRAQQHCTCFPTGDDTHSSEIHATPSDTGRCGQYQ